MMLNDKSTSGHGIGWWLCGSSSHAKQMKENKNYFPYELMIDYQRGGADAVSGPLQDRGLDLDYEVPDQYRDTIKQMLKKEAKLSRRADENFAYEVMLGYAQGGAPAVQGTLERRGYTLPTAPEKIQEIKE